MRQGNFSLVRELTLAIPLFLSYNKYKERKRQAQVMNAAL